MIYVCMRMIYVCMRMIYVCMRMIYDLVADETTYDLVADETTYDLVADETDRGWVAGGIAIAIASRYSYTGGNTAERQKKFGIKNETLLR